MRTLLISSAFFQLILQTANETNECAVGRNYFGPEAQIA